MTSPIGATFCSGIGAPELAAPWVNWQLASEIEKFPREVLQHRFGHKDARNHLDGPRLWGDFTALRTRHMRRLVIPLPDLIVAGTPCQSFSVAGLRRGTADDRGNLTMQFIRTCHAIRSARPDGRLSVLWENVPGVLSDKGNAFGAFLGGMVGSMDALPSPDGGSWPREGMVQGPWARAAWAVLDARWFGVAQRRRRVFVVFDFGNGCDPAAVLFERDSLRGHHPPRREKGEGVAPSLAARTRGGGGLGTDFELDGGLIASTGETAHCLNAGGMGRQDYETETIVAHALRGEGFDASEDETGRGTPLVPIAFDCKGTEVQTLTDGSHPTLRSMNHNTSHQNAGGHAAVAFAQNSRDEVRLMGGDGSIAGALSAEPGMKQTTYIAQPAVAIQERAVSENPNARPDGAGFREDDTAYTLEARSTVQSVCAEFAVRRLTARECERLQGTPDDHTLIPRARTRPIKVIAEEMAYLRKTYPGLTEDDAFLLAADGPRYKALGNSMAVPVVRWILDRWRISWTQHRQAAAA